MLDTFRRFTKTPLGKIVVAIPAIGILAGFALADIRSFGSGNIGFGGSSAYLAEVGDEAVTEAEMNDVLQRRLQEARQKNPDASYANLLGEFDQLLSSVIDQRVLIAFANSTDFVVSKRLVDAEITQLPGTKGLDGKFSEQAYQAFLAQRRMTDEQVRQIITAGLLQRLMLTPVVSNGRVSVGMATPYASMLLEAREGQAAAVPVEVFAAGLKASDADLTKFYSANRGRYTVPEQRTLRIARIGAAQVEGVTPTGKEIADYYKANAATYAAADKRDLSQVVVQDKAVAEAIARRARLGATLAAAAAPAGGDAAVSTLTAQTRAGYADVAGAQAASQVFGAAQGGVIGPVQTEFGWAVVKVDAVTRTGGKSLEAATGEIRAKLLADKRRQAIEDLADKVQVAIDDGATFEEAVAAAGLSASTTPLVTATGASLAQPGFRIAPADLPIVKTGFEIPAGDPPEVVALGDSGYALVDPGEIVSAAPPPLARIRDRVAADWVRMEALKRAKAAADAIATKSSKGLSLADAVRQAGVALPPLRPLAARRIQLVSAEGPVPPALETLFTLVQGKSKTVPDAQGRGFVVVKVDKVVPGNALLQPSMITRMQTDLQSSTSDAYAQQFIAAAAKHVKVQRNQKAIDAYKKRLATGTN